MLNVIFFEPRIAGNTGAAIRLSACTNSLLHLVEPLCFEMDDARLRRAGLDYHDLAHVQVHPDFETALAHIPGRVYAFTGSASTAYHDVEYADGDALLFGPEPTGLPEAVMAHPRVTARVRIPMMAAARSLNLANSAAIGLYEALRQLDFPDLV